MSIGIGGAGSKLASLLDSGSCTVVNVSETELSKVEAQKKILAVTHSARGQFKGAGRDPSVGKTAFVSISDEIFTLIKGDIVFASTGGGTGNGICSTLLKKIAMEEEIFHNDRTMFCLALPFHGESPDFVENTIDFLMDPVSEAIDSGNTGNIALFSNKMKFEARISENDYNQMIVSSLANFLAIPYKGDKFGLLDGHIDYEDFKVYMSRSYFNHFTEFSYDTNRPFGDQLRENFNTLLLLPERAIEALFLLEVPDPSMAPMLYNILDYFQEDDVRPVYGVVHNPDLEQPNITVSLLYSRKPRELVEDFKQTADRLTRKKLKKSIEQFVKLESRPLDITAQIRRIAETPAEEGQEQPPSNDVLDVLKRLKKLR